MLVPSKFFSVSELTSYIKIKLESDSNLEKVWVKGEISNLKEAFSGHLYFTLKDEKANLKCVMFRSSANSLSFKLEDGLALFLQGRLSVYEAAGTYQLYVNTAMPVGKGDLHLAFEQLKKKLEEEGLFEQKKEIPILPAKIGIVTSLTGAVLHDIINVSNRRYPGVKLILAKTSVQGTAAPLEIVKAIELLNEYGDVDVIIVGRGGGSLEELWAFNTEEVARAIKASSIPVISAVGHETDFTIADYVSDLRAPTPSAAAEIAVPDYISKMHYLGKRLNSFSNFLNREIQIKKEKLAYIGSKDIFSRPESLFAKNIQNLDYLTGRLLNCLESDIQKKKEGMASIAGVLQGLSPLKTLERGYAICRHENQILKDATQVKKGDQVDIQLFKGKLVCEVVGED